MPKFDVKFAGVELQPRAINKTYTIDAESEQEAIFKGRVLAAKEIRNAGTLIDCTPNKWTGRKAMAFGKLVEVIKKDGGYIYAQGYNAEGEFLQEYLFEELAFID